MYDYLSPDPKYQAWHFRRRFRIPLKLFRRIYIDLSFFESELEQKHDATARPGPAPWQKILNSLRRLVFASPYEVLDDQSRISSETQRKNFKGFMRGMKNATEHGI